MIDTILTFALSALLVVLGFVLRGFCNSRVSAKVQRSAEQLQSALNKLDAQVPDK